VPTVTIRVVLAEDNYLLREGTAALLNALDGVELVATAADKDELLAKVEEKRPDVVITDIRMPPEHHTEGLTAAAKIRTQYPGTGVILLTQFADPQYAYEFLSLGASGAGYLLKERIG
jgi:DNA-binding NarL/FixJ family response regulator